MTFIRRFPMLSSNMIFQYAERGRHGQHITFLTAVNQAVRLTLTLLNLSPAKIKDTKFPLHVFYKAPFWQLLDDPNVVEEVFTCSICMLDFLHYHEVIRVDELPVHMLEVSLLS